MNNNYVYTLNTLHGITGKSYIFLCRLNPLLTSEASTRLILNMKRKNFHSEKIKNKPIKILRKIGEIKNVRIPRRSVGTC